MARQLTDDERRRADVEERRHAEQLSRLHLEFVRANADVAGFHPEGRRAGSDYNLHHVEMDAPLPAQERFWRAAANPVLGNDFPTA